MKHYCIKLCIGLTAAGFLFSCAGRPLQAPAFYVPAPAAQAEVQVVEKPGESTTVLSPSEKETLLPPLPPEEVPPQQMAPLPETGLRKRAMQPPLPQPQVTVRPSAQVVEQKAGRPDSLAADRPERVTGAQQPASTLPSLQEGLTGRQQSGIEQKQETEIPEIPTRQQLRPPRQADQRYAPEEQREREIVQVPERQEDALRLQLLDEQNRLLRQQLQSMQTQQNYFQQQNEKLLMLALAAREQAPSTVIIQSDTSRQRTDPMLAPDTTSYSRMREQVRQLQQQIGQLQKERMADTATAMPVVAPPAGSDTALVKVVEQLRQQIALLKEASSDSAVQMPPLNVYFASGVSGVSDEALQKLRVWVSSLGQTEQPYTIVLNGFTDKSGSAELNLRLANKRIQAVKKALVALGVPQGRITNGYLGIDLQEMDMALARRVQLQVKP